MVQDITIVSSSSLKHQHNNNNNNNNTTLPTSGYGKGPIKVKSRREPDFNGYDDYSDRFMMTMENSEELNLMMMKN